MTPQVLISFDVEEFDMPLDYQYNIPIESLANIKIDEETTQKIPAKFAYQYKILPLRRDAGTLIVAVTDPLDLHALDDLRLLLDCDVKAVLCQEKEILKALKNIYGSLPRRW